MLKSSRLRLARKLFALGLLLGCFAAMESMPAGNARASAAICCSACDADPIPAPCFTHNCNPNC